MKTAGLSLGVFFLFLGSAPAAPISSVATGFDLVGGTVTVTFGSGAVVGTDIDPDFILGTGFAFLPGLFHFSVGGDTYANVWRLENVSTGGDVIVAVAIDLFGTGSVFDDDSLPSTPDSFEGRAGAVYSAGTAIIASTELIPWPNPANLGDLYLVERIDFAGIPAAGGFTEWLDDTDLMIPEPGTWFLCFTALVLFGFRNRVRSRVRARN